MFYQIGSGCVEEQHGGQVPCDTAWQLAPLMLLIDDLRLQLLTHKYVDDTAVSKTEITRTQAVVDALVNWSSSNRMDVNK